MSCQHIQNARLQPPGPRSSVHREDCTQCFDNIDDPTGLNVCLSCFNGGCTGSQNHAKAHHLLTQHPLVLNILRTKKPKAERHEPPQKMSKLSIEAETESDKYDITKTVTCYSCEGGGVDMTEPTIARVVEGVMAAMTSARQTEVKAWEQELVACEHTLCLQQDVPKQLEAQNLAHCTLCDLKGNLWLCLQCGNLGCGRAQFGGSGGNSHALGHFTAFEHPVAVKLGSITPEGTADIYCYACNDEKVDPELAAHLAYWGINIAEREKTEKSLTEMQIEHNLKWQFSMTTEDGKELRPLFGSGLTGLKNLGNSCYMNSILQCLFTLPEFKKRYYDSVQSMPVNSLNPGEDLEIQLRKIAHGLLSGRYSKPDSSIETSHDSSEISHQHGLAPAMLKSLIGKGHEEFSTMRQQDAFEFLLHLFKLITRSQHAPLEDPISSFKFAVEQRLQCLSCKRVSYKTDIQDNITVPVPARRKTRSTVDMEVDAEGGREVGTNKDIFESVTIKECLDVFTGDEVIDYTCKACGGNGGARKCSRFKTFPDVLAVNCRRFEVIDWVPTKLDVPVVVEDVPFSLDTYVSKGLQPGEEELPKDVDEKGSKPKFAPLVSAMQTLQEMGFPEARCVKALYNTGNSDADTAMNWLFAHMEDPDIDVPLTLKDDSTPSVDPESVEMLASMGFTVSQAKKALKETGGDMERAVEWLFNHTEDMGEVEECPAKSSDNENVKEAKIPGCSEMPTSFQLNSIVCHKGGSLHAGHYVAFVRKYLADEDQDVWILFNDEKVVKALDVEEMKKFAYIYFFKRI